MPGLTKFPKPLPTIEEQLLEAIKRLEKKIDELLKNKKDGNNDN